MGWMPDAPSAKETASAQTATNIGTAVANAWLGNVNQVTPDGTLTYDQTGTYKYTDPLNGKVHDIPIMTATQTLSEQQQKIKDQGDAASLNLATLANNQSARIGDLLKDPLSLSGAPAAGKASSLTAPKYTSYSNGPQLQTGVGDTGNIQTGVSSAGNIQTGIGSAGDITRTYGADYGSNVQQVQDALFSRLNPQLENDRAALEQRLANQGIMPGSKAYETAMNQNAQSVNDARTSVLLAAGQEQSRLAGLDAQRASFENSAQQQAYNQLLGSGQFANAAQAQQYSQNANDASFANSAQQQAYTQALGNAGLNNDALQQMYANQATATQGNNALASQKFADQQTKFNAQNAARNQYLDEQYALRNQNINETTALMSGSQVSSPNFVNTSMPQIANTDYAGLVQQQYQSQLSSANSLLGGLFGLGNSFLLGKK